MLALLAVMAVPGTAFDGASPGFKADAAGHAQTADLLMADMLDDCCGVEDGKMHHSMGGCAMDCSNAVPSIITAFGETDADLKITHAAIAPDGIALTQFRPPIAA